MKRGKGQRTNLGGLGRTVFVISGKVRDRAVAVCATQTFTTALLLPFPQRATGATKLNELSSRSHAVCVIIVEKCTPTQGEDAQKQGEGVRAGARGYTASWRAGGHNISRPVRSLQAQHGPTSLADWQQRAASQTTTAGDGVPGCLVAHGSLFQSVSPAFQQIGWHGEHGTSQPALWKRTSQPAIWKRSSSTAARNATELRLLTASFPPLHSLLATRRMATY